MFNVKIMIYLPTFKIAKILVLTLTKVLRIDAAYYKLFATLFQVTGSLLFNFGIIPTLKVVFNVFKAIYKKSNYQTLSRLLNQVNLNPVITSKILEAVNPFWNYCMKHPRTFKRLYHIYVTSVLFSAFKLSFIFIVRFIFSGVLFSFGILWNEFLSSFTLFANVANFIIENVSDVFKNIFYILTPVNFDNSVVEDVQNVDSSIHKGEWLTVVSLAVLGLTGIVILTMIGDYYSPEIVRSIPYAGNVLDSIYGFMQSIYDWYYTNPEIGPKPNPEDLPYQERIRLSKFRKRSMDILPPFNNPNIISRSSSGSSTVTSGSIPTPPATRTPTPDLTELPPPTFDSDIW